MTALIQHRRRVPGGDRRYKYVPFDELLIGDQGTARAMYPYVTKHLPHEEYMYPVKKNGSIARASRWISNDRAQELYDLYQVKLVMES